LKKHLILLLLILLLPKVGVIEIKEVITRTNNIPESVTIKQSNVNNIDPAIILASISWHETGNLSWAERWLVMEATWNRISNDFNCNGANFKSQLSAPKQFPKIFDKLYFDSTNQYHLSNYMMAQRIIEGERLSQKVIYYWGTKRDRHYKFCSKNHKNNPSITRWKTLHRFG
jgi:hypothetical protein